MKNLKAIAIVIITFILILALSCIFCLVLLSRLVGAILYNITDFIQYNSMRFDETKATAHELVTLPSQCYDVYKCLIEKRIKK